jgi:hypothetical protein
MSAADARSLRLKGRTLGDSVSGMLSVRKVAILPKYPVRDAVRRTALTKEKKIPVQSDFSIALIKFRKVPITHIPMPISNATLAGRRISAGGNQNA